MERKQRDEIAGSALLVPLHLVPRLPLLVGLAVAAFGLFKLVLVCFLAITGGMRRRWALLPGALPARRAPAPHTRRPSGLTAAPAPLYALCPVKSASVNGCWSTRACSPGSREA